LPLGAVALALALALALAPAKAGHAVEILKETLHRNFGSGSVQDGWPDFCGKRHKGCCSTAADDVYVFMESAVLLYNGIKYPDAQSLASSRNSCTAYTPGAQNLQTRSEMGTGTAHEKLVRRQY
jgi:hypothetical protein